METKLEDYTAEQLIKELLELSDDIESIKFDNNWEVLLVYDDGAEMVATEFKTDSRIYNLMVELENRFDER